MVNLYVKSENSLLTSLITIRDYINYANSSNIKVLGLADENLFGLMKFYNLCIENSIKPLIGLTIKFNHQPIVLYAINEDGYHNLLKLATKNSEGEINVSDLESFSDNLICIVPRTSLDVINIIDKIYRYVFIGYSTLQEREEILEAAYGGDSVIMLVRAMDGIRIAGGIFVIALSVLAIFLISNTIKSAIYSRNNEISIMRNVGATNGFIKMPFMIEGMVIGMIGAIVPILITLFGYSYLYNALNGVLLISMFKMQPVIPFAIYVSVALLATGMIVGMLGSFFAVNKYLRWKR